MNDAVLHLGRCIGCDRSANLDQGVCSPRLSLRGRRWAAMSHRCRTDPEFALAVHWQIGSTRARRIFVLTSGDVTGTDAPLINPDSSASTGGAA